ncbi:hypothetical protein MAE02_21040 [Microvirga aerophila]|uniref:Uncharacterized protein n=1 Tax=Microvirga aerophila TaxID=670291 RepID=A0A512BR30_9HYPH|nr:hypothetical protein MAE02_21040 [Microvirga aerophila]
MHCEDQDLGIRQALPDPARRFETIELGHGQVDDRHMGPMLKGEFDGFPAVRGFCADLPAHMLLQEILEATPDDIVIIGEKNAKHDGS